MLLPFRMTCAIHAEPEKMNDVNEHDSESLQRAIHEMCVGRGIILFRRMTTNGDKVQSVNIIYAHA